MRLLVLAVALALAGCSSPGPSGAASAQPKFCPSSGTLGASGSYTYPDADPFGLQHSPGYAGTSR
jgi:hypothetical protein